MQTRFKQTTKQSGDAAEDAALRFLQEQGLRLLQRNYRTPGRGGGEIDLILQESDSTLVFVEVRKRSQRQFGGALGSVSRTKQRRIVLQRVIFCGAGRNCHPPVLMSLRGSPMASFGRRRHLRRVLVKSLAAPHGLGVSSRAC